ncbi:MAG: hypothetical protein HKN57_15200 [Xanthomonadales bacterium]|nr:hypothetical protein [Gammaproteobacteria bacterium]MBT8053631.1 hypothetical protein [Gammaproteobacteria bacterium]NND58591.1 hypothetical protein [Xanthomonadales bacterium]NNK51019.1 hypothetical protein [Xanthomonadales bacterium]
MSRETTNPQAGVASSRFPLGHWLLAALVSLTVVLSSLTTVDQMAEEEYDALFQRALISFALARTLNGVISAVQGTELALQPAGVGVTLTPGQVLDPINDLVERFSWIMLGATISLGVQQVLLDIGQWWGVKLAFGLLGLAWLWLRLARSGSEKLVLRTFIIVAFIRFAVPVAMIANEGLYRLFLEERYVESTQVIEAAGSDIQQASQSEVETDPAEAESTMLDSLGQLFESTRSSMDLSARVDYIKERASSLIEHLIQLSVVFILQTGLLPIAFLWVFLQLFKKIFRTEY